MIHREIWNKYVWRTKYHEVIEFYAFGGTNSGTTRTDVIQRYNCSADAGADSLANCPSAEAWGAAVQSPNGFIYWQEGYVGANSDDMNAMTIAINTVRSNIFDNGYTIYYRGPSANSHKGYFCGGRDSGGTEYSIVDAMNFATEADCMTSDLLTQDISGAGALSTHMKLYILGGNSSGGSALDDVEAMAFAVETFAQIANDLTTGMRWAHGAISNTYIYVEDGTTNNKMSPATETPIAGTTSGNGSIYGDAQNHMFMYGPGGDDGVTAHDECYKMAFATETWQELANVMAIGNRRSTATGV